MENLNSSDRQEKLQNNPDKIKEAVARDFDKTLTDLSSPRYSTEDIQEVVSSISSNNPVITKKLFQFQESNTSALEKILASYNEQIQECSKEDSELSLYFFIETNSYIELKEQLNRLGLNLEKLMQDYQNYIEERFREFPQEIKDKIKTSIGIKTKNISKVISESYKESNPDDFKNNRWIINSKIQEELGFINNELFPSLEAYLKLKSGAKIPEKYTNRFDTSYGSTNGFVPQNPYYINVKGKIGEIEELLKAPVNDKGNFDEGVFSTQNLFDSNNFTDSELLKDLGIESKEVSLLNEKDKQIEEQAMLYFMAAIAVQVGGEIVGGPIGLTIGTGVDLYDTFSDEETLLKIVQAAGLADKSFKMDKTWGDNVLAGLGIFPGVTQIIKGSKLAKYLDKVDPKVFKKAVEKVKEVLGVSKKTSIDKTNKIEKLANNELLSIIDKEFKDYTYFRDVLNKFILDDKHPMNIVNYLKNNETRNFTITQLKEILKLGEKNISQKEMVSIINAIYEGESILLKSNNIKRLEDLKNILLESNPKLFEIGGEISYEQNRILRSHAEKLSSDILPSLKTKLNNVISDIPIKDGFPAINVRAKSVEGIIDKIGRMRTGNNGKAPRINYNLSDMPDAVGGRITVSSIPQLEKITGEIENVFGKKNIYEIDNFYSSVKKENPYRVITYTVLVDGVPCEIQLTTLKSSLVADLWHNTGYKQIHKVPEEVIKKLANLQRQVTIYEHNLLK